MKNSHPDSATDIENIAIDILKESKAYHKLPTKVEQIVKCADLKLNQEISLHKKPKHFFQKTFGEINASNISKKILGLLDFKKKTIYIDLNQSTNRQRFVQLHEVGHKMCPWQDEVFRWDDERTISPDITELFEREASFFASAVLFQLDVFEEKANKLPLSINSALALSKEFGASIQATLRRYVQYSKKRCALIVLEKPRNKIYSEACVRNFFKSPSFAKEFTNMEFPEIYGSEFPFIFDMSINRKFREDGELSFPTISGDDVKFDYHYFDNYYNAFVLIKPTGEKIKSRTEIILTDMPYV